MVRYESDGIFDAPLDKVWELLEGHGDPETVMENHPSMLEFEVLDELEDGMVVRESFEGPEGPFEMTANVRMDPPKGWTQEITGGPLAGGTFTHTYEDLGDGRTRVELVGEFDAPEGMDEETILKAVDDLYTTAFHEDQRALKKL